MIDAGPTDTPSLPRTRTVGIPRPDRRHALGLLLVGVIGGSIPFVLFYEGLAT